MNARACILHLSVWCLIMLFCDACQKEGTAFQDGMYVGDMENGKPDGFGCFRNDSIVYEGEWKNGKPDGFGTYRHRDSIYAGQFESGIWNGAGRLTTDSMAYEGFWQNGQFQGEGLFTNSEGDTWHGIWEKGKLASLSYFLSDATVELSGG